MARYFFFPTIPIVFLEGMKSLENFVRTLPWAEKPDVIFTSNNFHSDEVFKLWAVEKVSKGATYVIGQHGNHYGTHRLKRPSVAEVISHKFFTWGWVADKSLHVPLFMFKNAGKKLPRYQSSGGLLFVQSLTATALPHGILADYDLYFEDQFKFVENLSADPRSSLRIRLHAWASKLNGFDKQRWQSFDENLTIDDGVELLDHLVSQNRLTVFAFDSTGFLEMVSGDVPAIGFWRGGVDHLTASVVPYYEALNSVGLIHQCPHDAASFINKIWDDPKSWWLSDQVVDARKAFANRFAKHSVNPSKELAAALAAAQLKKRD